MQMTFSRQTSYLLSPERVLFFSITQTRISLVNLHHTPFAVIFAQIIVLYVARHDRVDHLQHEVRPPSSLMMYKYSWVLFSHPFFFFFSILLVNKSTAFAVDESSSQAFVLDVGYEAMAWRRCFPPRSQRTRLRWKVSRSFTMNAECLFLFLLFVSTSWWYQLCRW